MRSQSLKIALLATCAALIAPSGCSRQEPAPAESAPSASSPAASTTPVAPSGASLAGGAASDCDYDKWKVVTKYKVDFGLAADSIVHVGKDATFEFEAKQNCKWTMKVTPAAQTWPNWKPNIKLDCTWKQGYANSDYPMTGNIDEHHVCKADLKHPIHKKRTTRARTKSIRCWCIPASRTPTRKSVSCTCGSITRRPPATNTAAMLTEAVRSSAPR